MAYADLNYTADQINEAISKALEGGSGGSASIPVVVVEGAILTQELQPNTYYEFGEVTSLTITLAPEQEGVYNEYMFEFISGATATTLNLPSDIKWARDEVPIIETDRKYQFSIVNNIACFISSNLLYNIDITIDPKSNIFHGNIGLTSYIKLNNSLIVDKANRIYIQNINYKIQDVIKAYSNGLASYIIKITFNNGSIKEIDSYLEEKTIIIEDIISEFLISVKDYD